MDTTSDFNYKKYNFTVRDGVSIVNFYANWSFYSKIQKLILKKIGQECGERFKIYNVNCEEDRTLAEKFEINYFPTLLIFKNGSIVSQLKGLQDKFTIEEMIKKIA
jgi:thioredoxin 1